MRLSDVAEVVDGVENVRNLGTSNGQPAVLVQITKQPGANVIEVVDSILAHDAAAAEARCRQPSIWTS